MGGTLSRHPKLTLCVPASIRPQPVYRPNELVGDHHPSLLVLRTCCLVTTVLEYGPCHIETCPPSKEHPLLQQPLLSSRHLPSHIPKQHLPSTQPPSSSIPPFPSSPQLKKNPQHRHHRSPYSTPHHRITIFPPQPSHEQIPFHHAHLHPNPRITYI